MNSWKVFLAAVGMALAITGIIDISDGWCQIGSAAVSVVSNSAEPVSSGSRGDYMNTRLTFDGASSERPRTVIDATYLYVVWEDTRSGSKDVYWRKFDRSGNAVTGVVNISGTGGNSVVPAVGVDGSGNSYVVWQEGTPYGTIYGAVIDGSGTITTGSIAISSNLCLDPDIDVLSDGTIWVVFHRRTLSDQNVYVRKFDNQFNQSCQRLLNKGTLPEFDKHPTVAASEEGTAHVFWRDMDTWWYDGIYYQSVTSTCGAGLSRFQASGEYNYPDAGWSGSWAWVVAYMSGNVYNLHGDNGIYRINDQAGTAGRPRVGDDPDFGYTVWSDSRNTHTDIYMDQAYGNNPFTDVRITDDPGSSTSPDIATYTSEPGKWWIVWQDNRDSQSEIYMTASGLAPQQVMFTVKDAAGATITTSDADVFQYRSDETDWTQIDYQISDASGQVTFNAVFPGDAFYAKRLISDLTNDGHTQKINHIESGGEMFTFLVYDENTNADLEYDTYTIGQTELILDHRLARMNLVVAFAWDVTVAYATDLVDRLTVAAHRFYDATNGQFWIDNVTIYDCLEDPENEWLRKCTDLRIVRNAGVPTTDIPLSFPVGQQGGQSLGMDQSDWGLMIPELSQSSIEDIFYETLPFRYHNKAIQYSRSMFENDNSNFALGKTLTHELGHYLFLLGDETKSSSSFVCGPYVCTDDIALDHASIMTYTEDGSELADGIITEFCHPDNHKIGLFNCSHHGSMWTKEFSCWEAMEFAFLWIDAVANTSKEILGPITTIVPRCSIHNDVLDDHGGMVRHLRIHRPVERSTTSETGTVSINRGDVKLGINGNFSFGEFLVQASTQEWVDIRPGDIITVKMNGYFTEQFEVIVENDDVIHVTMQVVSISDLLMDWLSTISLTPQPDRLRLAPRSAPQNRGDRSLLFTWSAHDLQTLPEFYLSDLWGGSQIMTLSQIDDSTFSGELTVPDSSKAIYEYVLSVPLPEGDSILAFGEFATSTGDPYIGGTVEIGKEYRLWMSSSCFSTMGDMLLVTLKDVRIFSNDGIRPLSSPVAVEAFLESKMWPDSGVLTIAPQGEVADSQGVEIYRWLDSIWLPVECEFDYSFGGWYTTITKSGLYVLAEPLSDPATISIVSPMPGTYYAVGDSINIGWTGAAEAESLSISISKNGGITFSDEIYHDLVPVSNTVSWITSDDYIGEIVFRVVLFDELNSFSDLTGIVYIISCGDANGDAGVNVGDAVFVINYVFKGGPAPDPLCTGDANGDGACNVGDAVYLIAYIFNSGPPPVEDCCL